MDTPPPDSPPDNQDVDAVDSLEESKTVVETPAAAAAPADTAAAATPVPPTEAGKATDSKAVVDATTSNPVPGAPRPQTSFKEKLLHRLQTANVYLLLFLLVIMVAGGVALASYVYSKNRSGTTTLQSGTLSQSTLDQLANSDASVGNNNQVLNVQSSAIFAGKVLVRNSLAVAGDLQVGGALSLTGLSVAGTSTLNQVQVAKNLAVSGDSALQGQLSVQKNLAVSGGGTFGGPVSATQLTASALQLNGDLNLTHHITAGGATPGRANGPALGSGGTVSISGSDTSGTLSINTGGSPPAGCFATITFASKFNATPHVIITPVGSDAAGLSYYVNRSSSNFSICTTSPAPASASFAFDYLVLD